MAHICQATMCLQHGRPGLGHGLPWFLGSSYTGSSERPPCFPLVCFHLEWERAKKDQGTAACNNPEQEDPGIKHGSTLDTATNPFVQPHILLPTPALLTLACNHLFSPPSSFRHRLVGTWATLNALWGVGRARDSRRFQSVAKKHL